MVMRALARGMAAGAAGATALNAVTYADMTLRARPASDTPEQAVQALLTRTGHQIPGEEADRANRLAGLGPLAGIATGVGVGAGASVFFAFLRRLPVQFGALAIGAAAMAAADLPLVKLGLTDPRTWSPADWLSDLIPHLAYGAVTFTVLEHWRRNQAASSPDGPLTSDAPRRTDRGATSLTGSQDGLVFERFDETWADVGDGVRLPVRIGGSGSAGGVAARASANTRDLVPGSASTARGWTHGGVS